MNMFICRQQECGHSATNVNARCDEAHRLDTSTHVFFNNICNLFILLNLSSATLQVFHLRATHTHAPLKGPLTLRCRSFLIKIVTPERGSVFILALHTLFTGNEWRGRVSVSALDVTCHLTAL